MKKKVSPISIAIGALIADAAVLSFCVGPAVAETYNWKLQCAFRTAATVDASRLFAENVKKESNGKINIKVYASNELVKTKGILGALQTGAIQMANSTGPYNARQIPEGNIEFGLPFSWRNWDEAWEAWTKYGLQEKVREAYAEKGIYFITIQPGAQYYIMTTKSVRKLDDLKGLKIRTWGLTARILKALGASPTSIPSAEQYVALQRGTVDGTVSQVFGLEAYKLKEVLRYVIRPPVISPNTTDIMMNLELWKSLPKDMQDAITRASTQHHAQTNERYIREGNTAVGEFLLRGAGEAITLPEADVKKIRKIAFAEWDNLGQKSPRLKELVGAMRKFMADKGMTAE